MRIHVSPIACLVAVLSVAAVPALHAQPLTSGLVTPVPRVMWLSGVFRPTGFGFTGSSAARATIEQIAGLLRPIQVDRIGSSGGGADIGPSVEAGQLPAMSLEVDGNYFLIHHTAADTVDKIDPVDMAKASAAIAVIAYVVADMPDRLR